jgi:solute carrier family 41
MLALPGHFLFYFIIFQVKLSTGHDSQAILSLPFIVTYLTVSTMQVVILFLICYWLVHLTWRRNTDPDNICIPYLTAIGDLVGE